MRLMSLDVPVYMQYGRWIGVLPTPAPLTGQSQFSGLLQGSLGRSLFGHFPIEAEILRRLPLTIELGVMAILIGLLLALPVGIYSAVRRTRPSTTPAAPPPSSAWQRRTSGSASW